VTQKTNAPGLLDQIGIPYELREYEVDLEDLSAESVAAKANLPTRQLFKKDHRCFPHGRRSSELF
jgi:Cys-tRNA(Pro)/Cys-tRNA(Cys) deacylase